MIKVFKINDYEWYAGNTEKEVIAEAISSTDALYEDIIDTNVFNELTEQELNETYFVTDEYDYSKKITFKEQLNKLIKQNTVFPCAFASTDW